MEYKPLINVADLPKPKRSNDKVLIACWIIVVAVLAAALVNGLMMRGVL